MKYLSGLLLLVALPLVAQQVNTDVYLLNLDQQGDKLIVDGLRNISNNPGYDNQPAFQSNTLLLYAANRNGQTDIAQYSLKFEKQFWVHESEGSSQYSPQPIPDSPHLTSIHLKPSGYQRLYRHHLTTGNLNLAHPDLQVAYYAMFNDRMLLASVLGMGNLDLVWADLETGKVDTLLTRSGRSIHRMVDGKAMSYTAINEEGNWDVFQFEPPSRESFFVVQLPVGVQDHVWLDDTRLLIGSGSKLFLYDPFRTDKWMEVADLSPSGLENITRMAVSPDRKHLALVAETVDND